MKTYSTGSSAGPGPLNIFLLQKDKATAEKGLGPVPKNICYFPESPGK
jgi:hypothetical protein